ncbi:aminopeptidase N [Pseudoalteromonas sp. T1lg65]|uniref:aminopeptidase N n=1 Tax=Pseudoalteromonas sp. T1lg65 TaxID=2077101 RepID=UPI003F7AAA46
MSTKPKAKLLKDYQSPTHSIETLDLTFELSPNNTLVTAKSRVVANRTTDTLYLDGVDLELVAITVNDQNWTDYHIKGDQLVLKALPEQFTLQVVTRISPQTNTSLEGLYLSDGAYCTQCEAEGFRKITYFMDRPDVLTSYRVKIIADQQYKYLLSNGNKVDEGQLDDGRHFAIWHDPHKKPSYLFALVAGDFDVLRDKYETQSGKQVDLELFVDKGNLYKAPHAMESLKKAMQWDEERFNLEYDLDIYMIVAVDFFNMGAMENKGLNIFNSSCVLASQDTATDRDFHNIESIVGHEYFHNWTGNRVTCRDWFQLSLKEGLTVFRDQEFSSDLGSRGLNRIDAVMMMRTHQFAEDEGPMAHPIRPQQVIEMNNFYTVTVYNKGAEVIRMMHTILGEANFQKGMALYFERHDGQAVTCDDFVSAMADASGIDLSQFKLWYEQFGTPKVTVLTYFDKQNQTFTIETTQHHASNDPISKPLHIPLKLELLDEAGNSLPLQTADGVVERVLDITESKQSVTFTNITSEPVPVLFEDFSAPIKLEYDYSINSLLHILKYARSDYARWEAMQQVFMSEVKKAVLQKELQPVLAPAVIESFRLLLKELKGDLALLAELITLPSFETLASQFDCVDVDRIVNTVQVYEQQIAESLKEELYAAYTTLPEALSLEPEDVAIRAFKSRAIYYLVMTAPEKMTNALRQAAASDNMTTKLGALKAAVANQHSALDELMANFESQWQHDPLVMDKWFALWGSLNSDLVINKVHQLYTHSAFDKNNPNRVRSLVGSFTRLNPQQFHREDGAGYELLGSLLIELNGTNPQLASRLITPFMSWKRYSQNRQKLMTAQLQKLFALPNLSDDLFEKVEKALR